MHPARGFRILINVGTDRSVAATPRADQSIPKPTDPGETLSPPCRRNIFDPRRVALRATRRRSGAYRRTRDDAVSWTGSWPSASPALIIECAVLAARRGPTPHRRNAAQADQRAATISQFWRSIAEPHRRGGRAPPGREMAGLWAGVPKEAIGPAAKDNTRRIRAIQPSPDAAEQAASPAICWRPNMRRRPACASFPPCWCSGCPPRLHAQHGAGAAPGRPLLRLCEQRGHDPWHPGEQLGPHHDRHVGPHGRVTGDGS
jgi:hypothetical protein